VCRLPRATLREPTGNLFSPLTFKHYNPGDLSLPALRGSSDGLSIGQKDRPEQRGCSGFYFC